MMGPEILEDSERDENKDLDLICRLCGKHSFDSVPIFGNDDLAIAEKISRCLPIVVLSNDNLPSRICPNCVDCLNRSYNLIVTSVKVDLRLRKLLAAHGDFSDILIDSNSVQDAQNTQEFSTEDIFDTCTVKLNPNMILGPMECEMCNIAFLDMEEFDCHVETNHLLSWCCGLCDKSFESSEELASHRKGNHAGNIITCTSCTEQEKLDNKIVQHQNTKCQEKSYSTEKNIAKRDRKKKKSSPMSIAMCEICNIPFGTENKLFSTHLKIHKPRRLRCYTCNTEVASVYELFIHKQKAHDIYKKVQLKFVCDDCGKLFTNSWQWLEHQKVNNCKKKRSAQPLCKYCGSIFSTNTKLTIHLRKHKEEMLADPTVTVYHCVACPKIFVDKQFYQKHRNVHDPEYYNKLRCHLCQRSFRDRTRFREHQLSFHEGQKPHECDICKGRFYRLSNMIAHRKKHLARKCEQCNEIFPKMQLLVAHLKDVHNIEPSPSLVPTTQGTDRKYVCKFCGKKLATTLSLFDHENIHTDEKPYECKTCNKTFRSYTAKWAHIQTHKNSTVICETCGKSFGHKKNLRVHMEVHKPVESRKHRCLVCQKRFLRKTYLNVHMRIHSGVRPYTCDICNMSFTQYGDMRRHRDRHASGRIRTKRLQSKLRMTPKNENGTS